jgi:hypothetical protein
VVRGIQKQIIHLKNPESALFEEAFLVLKLGARQNVPTLTMVEEANRLIDAMGTSSQKERKKRVTSTMGAVLLFLTGALSGTLFTLLFLI